MKNCLSNITVPSPMQLTQYEFILTDDCNIRCKYCFDDYYSGRSGCSESYSNESIESIIDFIEATASKNHPILFSMFGGEPLVVLEKLKQLTEAIEKISGRFVDHSFSINTNMMLLNAETLEYLRKYKYKIIVSLDGIKEAHDINRVDRAGEGTWDKAVSKLRMILKGIHDVKERREISALMVVNSSNFKLLERGFEFLNALGVSINILFDYTEELTKEHYESMERQLHNLFVKKQNRNFSMWSRIERESTPCFCFKPSSSVTIAPNGSLYFCHQFVPKMADETTDESFPFGNIFEGYTNYRNTSHIAKRVRTLPDSCKSCSAKEWCRGGCIAGNYHSAKSLEVNPESTQCRIHKLVQQIHDEAYPGGKSNAL
ncbi:MAG: radical SAM protein [Candidatus Thorarchaeota archaeon]